MSYTNGLDKPSDYFETKLYTGTGSSHAVTGVGFQSDWTWIKRRDAGTNYHVLTDSVRGATVQHYSNHPQAEQTVAEGLKSFDSDGFTLGTNGDTNGSSRTYASWNWLAGTTGSGTTTGLGTGKAYSYSANSTSGFQITKYVGNGTLGHTIPNHTGKIPTMIIFKQLNESRGWGVYHKDLGANKIIYLNETIASQTIESNQWMNGTVPTSSVVTLGTLNEQNKDGADYIMYSFSNVQSYCKMGSYTGNGSTDGTFVYTGFKPAWIMFKPDSSADWTIVDAKRNTFNVVKDKTLNANLNSAEHDGSADLDFLSNGFKIRNANTDTNHSGTIIYMAFAESPFVNSNGVPNNAR